MRIRNRENKTHDCAIIFELKMLKAPTQIFLTCLFYCSLVHIICKLIHVFWFTPQHPIQRQLALNEMATLLFLAIGNWKECIPTYIYICILYLHICNFSHKSATHQNIVMIML